jgi:hypothetical protein
MASEPPPFSFDSINRLHDAAEMFLALAAQVHGVAIPRDFMGYWDGLEGKLGRPISYRANMQKFNKVRVNLKHYGIEPAAMGISDAKMTVSALLQDECPALFGVALEDVSLTSFVTCAEARALLESAETSWTAGELIEGMADLSQAFAALIRDYEQRKMLGHNVSVFDNTQDMTFESPIHRHVSDAGQKRFDEKVITSLKDLDFAVMLLGLGVDFRRYGKFKALTPKITRMASGRRRIFVPSGKPLPIPLEFEFCRDFVVTTAIHLADFDYDTDWSKAYRAARAQSADPGQEASTKKTQTSDS